MSEKVLLEFESEINQDGQINLPSDKFEQLSKIGINKVLIKVIQVSQEDIKSKIKSDLFEKIKIMQALPDEVIQNFLDAKGKLKNFFLRNSF